MKRKSQIIAGVLAMLMLFCACSARGDTDPQNAGTTTAVPMAQQGGGTGFTDVDPGAWYAEAIIWCRENGIMSGTSDTEFSPEASMTRAMFAAVLHRAAGTPAGTGENVFTDNVPGSWSYDAVIWAAENNVLAGYGDGRFGSDDPVTREQAAAILHRYAGSPDSGTSPTAVDASAISSYAVSAVTWASANGLLRTDDSGRINPNANASRGEAA